MRDHITRGGCGRTDEEVAAQAVSLLIALAVAGLMLIAAGLWSIA